MRNGTATGRHPSCFGFHSHHAYKYSLFLAQSLLYKRFPYGNLLERVEKHTYERRETRVESAQWRNPKIREKRREKRRERERREREEEREKRTTERSSTCR